MIGSHHRRGVIIRGYPALLLMGAFFFVFVTTGDGRAGAALGVSLLLTAGSYILSLPRPERRAQSAVLDIRLKEDTPDERPSSPPLLTYSVEEKPHAQPGTHPRSDGSRRDVGITAGIVVAVGVILAVVVVAAIQSTSPALPTNEPVVTETPIATHRDFEQELADERHRNDMLQARHADELAEKDARIRELDTRLVSTPPIRTVTVTPGRKAVQGRQALRVGLTRAEVLKLQGNPYHKMASRGKEVWYFGRLMDDYIIFDSGSGVVTGWKNKTGALRD